MKFSKLHFTFIKILLGNEKSAWLKIYTHTRTINELASLSVVNLIQFARTTITRGRYEFYFNFILKQLYKLTGGLIIITRSLIKI